jgi:7,8-dihydropterin-6-yl-methyl-4-(beta-D-ribofuranosyl)aminobenzene 5'-phosphate synthase
LAFFRRHHRLVCLTAAAVLAAAAMCANGGETTDSSRRSPLETRQAASLETIRITVLYDNVGHRPDLAADWGFSCLVEGTAAPILFDTGGAAQVLQANLAVLGIDLSPVGAVFISHAHHDHAGGMAAVLADGKPRTFFLPASMAAFVSKELERRGQSVVAVKEPAAVTADSFSTGQMDSFIADEHALVVRTDRGLIVVSGCAHPGIEHLAAQARSAGGDDILLVMGGFHLMNHAPADIQHVISSLKKLGTAFVAPSHCTGDPARRLFAEAFGDGFIDSGVGCVISGKDLANRLPH